MTNKYSFLEKHRSKAELFHFLTILVLALYPILPYAVVSIAILSVVFSSLFLNINKVFKLKDLLIQVAFYCILIISLTYSTSLVQGFNELKTNVVILVLPIVFLVFINPLVNKNIKTIFLFYVVSNVGLVLVLFNFFSSGIITDRFPNLIEEGIWAQLNYLWSYPFEFVLSKSLKGSSSWFMNHKTILALNFLIASLLSLRLFFVDFKSTYFRFLLVIPVFIFVICIVYTQALVNIALLPILLIYSILKIKKKSVRFGVSVFVIFISFILFIKLDITEAFDNGNTKSVKTMVENLIKGEINGDSEPRLFIYYCDMYLIKKQFLTGYGIGDVQNELNQCYNTHQFEAKFNKDRIFNSHNYYAHLLLSAGVLALILFIIMFLYNGTIAFNNRDYAYLFFLLIIAVNLLTDNILVRFQSALCFALFNSLFLINNLKENNE